MSINTELKLLKNTKENLRTAIMEKGVVVSSSDLFSTYPTRISQISTQSGTYDESLKKLLDGSYTSYEIPNGTEKLKANAFRSYTSLASITIPPTIKTVGSYAFKDCTSLNRVNITDLSAWCGIDFKTAESGSDISSNPLRTADRLYMNGTQITNLVIPSDVTEIKPYVFYSASGFTSVVIPDSVTTIGSDAFSNCTELKTVEIGTGITTIDTRAFYYCSKLTSITVKADTPPTIGGGVFNNTNNCPIYVPEDSVEAYKSAWPDYASRIQAIVVPTALKWTSSDGTQEISIACEDLAEAGTLTQHDRTTADTGNLIERVEGSAEIGDCVTTIGNAAFEYCSALASINIPDSVTSIESNAFEYCTSLTSVTIPDSVTSIESSTFRSCSALTSVNIPDSVTAIGSNAFSGCSELTSVTIPSGVTRIGNYAFQSCSSLTSITINADTPPTLGYIAFDDTNNCPIYVPEDSVEAYKSDWPVYADRIQAIPVPNKMIITYGNGGISETISIPEDHICDDEEMSYPTTIRACDFHELYASHLPTSDIKTITIGENVEIIELSLGGCIGLESITVEATTPPEIYGDVFNSAETNYCPIYVPADSLQVYLDDPNWGMYYSSRLQAIPEPVVPKFVRISETTDATDGKYLIVNMYSNRALDASLITSTTGTENGINNFRGGNTISVTIEQDGTITANAENLNAAAYYDATNQKLYWEDGNNVKYYLLQRISSSTNFKYINTTSRPTTAIRPYKGNANYITLKQSYYLGGDGSNTVSWYSSSSATQIGKIALFKYVEE